MKVAVTGGAGFIGQYVCEALITLDHEPLVFDHLGRGEYEVMLGDVRDPVSMTELAAHVDGIIHLAACLGTQETVRNPRPATETNIMGGLNFLEACSQHQIPGCYIGVGNFNHFNPYSITKTTIERFCTMYNRDRSGRFNIVRAMNAYGPRQLAAAPYGPGKVRKITPSFVCRALRNHPLEIYGDGLQVSDMVYVGDVAMALVLALEAAARGEVFEDAIECGPADHNTVLDVARLVIELAESKSEIVHLPMRPGEVPGAVVVADVKTLKRIGMESEDMLPLREGMTKTIEYFQGQMHV